jgi:phosphoribosylamine--glycine ligase
MASKGYPAAYFTGEKITGLNEISNPDVKIFHAGTKIVEKDRPKTITNGGRVLCAAALGANIAEAQKNAYAAIKKIAWDGAFYRDDIAYRAIARENKADDE